MPVPTVFHSRTSKLCTSMKWKDWAGYFAVCSYGACHEPEYFAIRHSAGLIDVSPLDLEAAYGVSGGHLFRGEHATDQLVVRPTPECAAYRTPFEGLFLCGSGSHPGGGITCAPGALAAHTMLGK